MQPLEEKEFNNSNPNEPLLEHILSNQSNGLQTNNTLLEHILVETKNNNIEPLLENNLVQSKVNTDEIVKAIKDIPKPEKIELPEQKEIDLSETNKLLIELTKEVKKKEEYEYEVEIDSNLKEKLKGEKGQKGLDGKNGKDGKDGLDGKNGKNGKDGKDGNIISSNEIKTKLESLKGEERLDISAIKGVKKIEDQITRLASSKSTYVGGNGLGDAPSDGKQYARKDATWSEVTIPPDTNDKVKISSNDTTAGYLNGKIIDSNTIYLTENSNGGNETLDLELDIPTSGTITRTSDLVSSIALTKEQGTDNITVNRTSNLISSIVSVYNGITKTTTLTRDGNNKIISFNIT